MRNSHFGQKQKTLSYMGSLGARLRLDRLMPSNRQVWQFDVYWNDFRDSPFAFHRLKG